MRKLILMVTLLSMATIGAVFARQGSQVDQGPAVAPAPTAPAALPSEPAAEPKCGSNSDCKYGGCSGGKCGSCSASSDCNGWGNCKDSWCGYCSNNSDCTSFGDCNSGKCSRSPY